MAKKEASDDNRKQKKQEMFTAIDLASSPINIETEKGIMRGNRNGFIFSEGGNNFSWTNDNGNKRLFAMPPIAGIDNAEIFSRSNLYYFDGRSIEGYSWNKSRVRKFSTYVSKVDAYGGKTLIGNFDTEVTYNYPSLNDVSIVFTLQHFSGTSTVYTSTIATASLPAGWSLEHYVHSKIDYVLKSYAYDTLCNFTLNLKKHGTMQGQSNFVPELEHTDKNLIDFTWYNEFIYNVSGYNIIIECSTNAYDEVAGDTTVYHNVLGWGAGSENGNSGFPMSGPFPVPGSDFDINPYAIERPNGFVTNFKGGRKYVVYEGSVYLGYIGSTMPVSGDGNLKTKGDVFRLSDASTQVVSFLSKGTKVLECWPDTFAYSLQTIKYSAAVKRWKDFGEIVGCLQVNDDAALLFYVHGSPTEILQIFTLTFNKTGYRLNKIIDTPETLGLSYDRQIKNGFCRIEANDNIKAYWIIKSGHIRVLDVINPPTENIEFNTRLFKPITFGKIQVSGAFRSGGTLLVGSYQFCYDASIDGVNYTRCSTHTNPISIGQSKSTIEGTIGTAPDVTTTFPRGPKDDDNAYRGFIPGTKTTESIAVKITNIDKRYNFIRVYSIEEISGGGDSSCVINRIFDRQVTATEKHELNFIYTGIRDIVDSGLNKTIVESPSTIAWNVKDIEEFSNRLLVAGYDEFAFEADDTEIEAMSRFTVAQTNQLVGNDSSQNLPMAYKDWFNQQWYKTLEPYFNYEFAWVLEDEYGNQSEAKGQFTVPFDETMRLFDLKEFIGSTFMLSTLAPWKWSATIPDIGNVGYLLYSIGLRLNFNSNHSFPSWAKKARLVRKIREANNEKTIWGCGYRNSVTGSINQFKILNKCFIPDLHGYDSNEKLYPEIGDELFVYTKSAICGYGGVRVDKNLEFTNAVGALHVPKFIANVVPLQMKVTSPAGLIDNVDRADIADFNHGVIHKITKVVKGADGGVPFYTITLESVINEDEGGVGNGYDFRNDLVYFFIKKHNQSQVGAVKKMYENTGFELDLRVPYSKGKDYYIFGGDKYQSTVYQFSNTLARVIADCGVHISSPGMTNGGYEYSETIESENRYYLPMIPVLSRTNYSLQTSGWWYLIDFEEDTNYLLLTSNKDYSPSNSKIPMFWIDPSYLKLKTRFKNNLRYTDVKISNSKADSYTLLPENNFIDLVGPYGEIEKIVALKTILIVFYTTGIGILHPNEKELMTSVSGTRVKMGGAEFILTRDDIRSFRFSTSVNVIKTEFGVYFIDGKSKAIGFVDPSGKVDIISVEKFVEPFMDKNIDLDDSRNDYVGMSLGYDKTNKRIFFEVSSKRTTTCEVSISNNTTIGIIKIKAGTINLSLDEIVSIENDFYFCIARITAYDEVNNEYHAELEDSGYFMSKIHKADITTMFTITKVATCVYINDCLYYNEYTGMFEGSTSKVSSYSFIGKDGFVTVSPHNNNTLYIKELSALYNEENPSTGVPSTHSYKTSRFDLWWNKLNESATLYVNEHTTYVTSKAVTVLPRGFILDIYLNHNSTNIIVFNKSSRIYQFIKGYTYTIVGDITINSGGCNNQGNWKLYFGVHPAFNSHVTFISNNGFDMTPTGTYDQMLMTFKAKESFDSPLCLYKDNIEEDFILANILFEIREVSQFEQFEAYPVLLLNQKNMDQYNDRFDHLITLDNLEISVPKDTIIPNKLTFYTPEQEKELIVDTATVIVARKRLGEIRASVPFLRHDNGDKERIRGTYVLIKPIFTNNITKFVISKIKFLFRESI